MKAPTKQLTPEVKRRVAEILCIQVDWAVPFERWHEVSRLRYFAALTHKLAQVIEAMPEGIPDLETMKDDVFHQIESFRKFELKRQKQEALCEALATNDTTALEALLAELMGLLENNNGT